MSRASLGILKTFRGIFDMVSDADRARLKALEQRIAMVKAAGAPRENHQKKDYSQANLAWRMVIELVAGLGIGFGIGYGLDRFFGTLPIFLVLFIFVGLAAGVKTMMRSAKEVQDKMTVQAAEKGED
jgi:ATP synthase protein I